MAQGIQTSALGTNASGIVSYETGELVQVTFILLYFVSGDAPVAHVVVRYCECKQNNNNKFKHHFKLCIMSDVAVFIKFVYVYANMVLFLAFHSFA